MSQILSSRQNLIELAWILNVEQAISYYATKPSKMGVINKTTRYYTSCCWNNVASLSFSYPHFTSCDNSNKSGVCFAPALLELTYSFMKTNLPEKVAERNSVELVSSSYDYHLINPQINQSTNDGVVKVFIP